MSRGRRPWPLAAASQPWSGGARYYPPPTNPDRSLRRDQPPASQLKAGEGQAGHRQGPAPGPQTAPLCPLSEWPYSTLGPCLLPKPWGKVTYPQRNVLCAQPGISSACCHCNLERGSPPGVDSWPSPPLGLPVLTLSTVSCRSGYILGLLPGTVTEAAATRPNQGLCATR